MKQIMETDKNKKFVTMLLKHKKVTLKEFVTELHNSNCVWKNLSKKDIDKFIDGLINANLN